VYCNYSFFAYVVLSEAKHLSLVTLRFSAPAKYVLRDEGSAAVQNNQALLYRSDAILLNEE
jgi:hypothetical protein